MGKIKQFFSKITAKDKRGRDFSDVDQMKSQVSRSKKDAELLSLSIQKMRFDAKKRRLEALKSKFEENDLDDQIADLEDELDQEDDDPEFESSNLTALGMKPEDAAFLEGGLNLLTKAGIIKSPITSVSPVTPSVSPQASDVSDEEIDNMIARINPIVLKQLKKKSDEELYLIGKENYPEISQDTIKRMIAKVKA